MDMSREILWKPPEERSKNAALAKYMDWLKQHYSNDFSTYQDLWEWSINDLEQLALDYQSYQRNKQSIMDDQKQPVLE